MFFIRAHFHVDNEAKLFMNLDDVLKQDAYLTNLQSFIEETNPKKALSFWLTEYCHLSSIQSVSDIEYLLDQSITTIDHLINDQLNVIIHHPRFQQLEASWRGLHFLVEETQTGKNLKIKVLDVCWKTLAKDLRKALEFDQSQLFQKIYSQEYDTPGGEPYGVLIGDYEISHKPSEKHPDNDLSILTSLSHIAAAAFAPFIASASSELFGLDSLKDINSNLNFDQIFSQPEYHAWHQFRKSPDSRFFGLTLPKFLIRKAYRTQPGSYKGVFFFEKNDTHHSSKLWCNTSYAFAAVLGREFNHVGWFGHIRGVPRSELGGGLLFNLILENFETERDGFSLKPSTEVVITDNLERDLSQHGFIPLCQCYNAPLAAFFNNQSIHKRKTHSDTETALNAKLSSMLQHILCASRMTHYVKVIMRDKVGSFLSAQDCENYLRNWLLKYTSGSDDMEWETQARYPLKEARVNVQEHQSKPGKYLCAIQLKPHYQLDHMVSELELVTELSQ